jgi:hypothetical protein
MTVWLAGIIIFGLGLVGGLANAYMTDKGFHLPSKEGNLLLPGFLGNMFIGGIAAVVLWGLYSAFGQEPVTSSYTPTLAEIIGGLVSGAGGARLLTNEIEKQALRQTAVSVARAMPNLDLAQKIATQRPVEALRAAVEVERAQ